MTSSHLLSLSELPAHKCKMRVNKLYNVKTSHVVVRKFVNVTYCEGEIVAITYDGKIVGCNVGSIDTCRSKKKKNSLENAEDVVKVRLIADLNPLLGRNRTETLHLVAVDDKLIIAARHLEKILSSSKKDLYMLIEVDVWHGKATEVNDLRKRLIFLGEHNEAFSVEATSRYRFKPNCIYFAHHVKGPKALDKTMCIYNLADGVYEHHHKS
ncbi:hypothetical protein Droror1_Dr00011169 [Drosera rotundifolia]